MHGTRTPSRRATVRRRTRNMLGTCALIGAMWGMPVATAAPPGAIALGTAEDSTGVKVLVDRAGITHVLHARRVDVPTTGYQLHYTRRPAGAAGFEADRVISGLPFGDVIQNLQIIDDPVGNRLLMFASLGFQSFVMVSTDGGATWTAPKQYWDEFIGSDQVVRPTDGAIGVTPSLTEVDRLIIPPSLPFLRRGDYIIVAAGRDLLDVSNRISSRVDVRQAFGPDGTAYTMFEAGAAGGWVHVGPPNADNTGADAGQANDRRVAEADTNMDIASGPRGAAVLEAPMYGTGPLLFHPLTPAGAGPAVTVPHAPGSERAVFPKLVAAPDGTFHAIWRSSEGSVQGLVMRRSTDGGQTWGGLLTLAALTDGGLSPAIAAGASISVGGADNAHGAYGYRDPVNGQATVVAFNAAAVDPAAGGGGTPPPNPSPSQTPTPTAALTGFRAPTTLALLAFRRSGVVVRVTVTRATPATVQITRGTRRLLTKRITLRAGANTVRVRAPRITRGRYTITVMVGATRRRTVIRLR